MGLSYSVINPDIKDEQNYLKKNMLIESIQALAQAKAESISLLHHESLVLGCDTIVVIDNQILGKPSDYNDAKDMLHCLSGRIHKVYSGIAVICKSINFIQTAVACTDVFFRTISEYELEDYLRTDEYIDKAGGYAIQGKAMNFINKINGCFYNVMGLPVQETIAIFKAYQEFSKGFDNV